MIRTDAQRMTSINGLSFKQKLKAGGAGITIITPDDRATFTINKRDGKCVPYGAVNSDIFNEAVINEALELSQGLPYRRLGKISKVYPDNRCEESAAEIDDEDEKVEIDVIASAEYREFIAEYTDKKNRFSYQLMNKDLMQFAAKSSIVGKKLVEKESVENIVRYIVKSKAADLTRNRGMDEDVLTAFIETFDSMDTRSAFKELKAYMRGQMSRRKK